jgi:hypothetical protein
MTVMDSDWHTRRLILEYLDKKFRAGNAEGISYTTIFFDLENELKKHGITDQEQLPSHIMYLEDLGLLKDDTVHHGRMITPSGQEQLKNTFNETYQKQQVGLAKQAEKEKKSEIRRRNYEVYGAMGTAIIAIIISVFALFIGK